MVTQFIQCRTSKPAWFLLDLGTSTAQTGKGSPFWEQKSNPWEGLEDKVLMGRAASKAAFYCGPERHTEGSPWAPAPHGKSQLNSDSLPSPRTAHSQPAPGQGCTLGSRFMSHHPWWLQPDGTRSKKLIPGCQLHCRAREPLFHKKCELRQEALVNWGSGSITDCGIGASLDTTNLPAAFCIPRLHRPADSACTAETKWQGRKEATRMQGM